MPLLLDDRLAPITSEYGFIEASYSAVARWFHQWDAAIQQPLGRTVVERPITGGLERALQLLAPLTAPLRRRFLFMATASAWCGYFDNGARGGDAAALSHVAMSMGCRAMRIVAVPDSSEGGDGRYGAATFELYGPERREFLNYVRSVGVLNDGGRWKFISVGPPLEGENISDYKARRIRDRFSFDQLNACAQLFGVRAFDPTFFGSDGILVERVGPMGATEREYSLEQARAR